MVVTILVFLLVLSILVLIHEAGHFFVAKKMGVKVEEFGFGFPPRIYGKKFGETIYSINLLPIGGFVKMYGEDEAGGGKIQTPSVKQKIIKDTDRAFFAKNPWQRAAIIVAGVVMNFVLAVVIISYLFTVQGVPVPGNQVIIAAVVKNSPAGMAGLVPGDTVLSLNGNKITSPDQLIQITKRNLGVPINLQIQMKNHVKKTITLTPRKVYPKTEGAMGVAVSPSFTIKKYLWYQAPFVGTVESLEQSWLIIVGLGQAVYQFFVGHAVPEGLSGPIGIAQLTGEFVKVGFTAVLSLVAMLSLNLAVLNILPIPALDGGRLFFILIEAVTGKKVSQKIEGYIHSVGMAILLALILLITFHDVYRIVMHQPLLPK